MIPHFEADIFANWDPSRRPQVTGYTLRSGNDIASFSFPPNEPSATTSERISGLVKDGWQITAIRYVRGPIQPKA